MQNLSGPAVYGSPKAEKRASKKARKKERRQPNKKHSLCTLKGAHHPKMRNAVPIVFPRHVDNVDDTSGRKKYYGRKNASKQETKRETQKEEHERQNTRTNANREPIPP